MESLACLQGRLSNVELLPLACYKIPSLPLHTAMARLSETTLTLGEKRMSELSIASRIIPAGWKPLPQGYILSPTSQWSQKDCSWESKTMTFLFTGLSWWPGSPLTCSTSHLPLWTVKDSSSSAVSAQRFTIYREPRRRKFSKSSF